MKFSLVTDLPSKEDRYSLFLNNNKIIGIKNVNTKTAYIRDGDTISVIVSVAPNGNPTLQVKNHTHSKNGQVTSAWGSNWFHDNTTFDPDQRFMAIGAGRNQVSRGTGHIYYNHTLLGMALYDFRMWSEGLSATSRADLLFRRLNEIGNVFYEDGIIILENVKNQNFYSNTLGFKNTVVRDEYEYVCMLQDSEMNMSQNPTILASGSSADNPVVAEFVKNDWDPYITTIGLYNDHNELLAIGKLGRPIRKVEHYDQTFVVKWDK